MRSQVLFVLWYPGGFSPAVCSQSQIYTHSSGLSRRVAESVPRAFEHVLFCEQPLGLRFLDHPGAQLADAAEVDVFLHRVTHEIAGSDAVLLCEGVQFGPEPAS
jgi:hypothetical protein